MVRANPMGRGRPDRRRRAGTFVATALLAALAAGCSVSGQPVAAPGPPPTSSTTTTTTPSTSVPIIPLPPPNTATMTCREYNTLGSPTQIAVVTELGAVKNQSLVAVLVSVLCRNQPDSTVKAVIEQMRNGGG